MIDTFLAQTGIAALQLASRQAIMAVTWISKMFVESSTYNVVVEYLQLDIQ